MMGVDRALYCKCKVVLGSSRCPSYYTITIIVPKRNVFAGCVQEFKTNIFTVRSKLNRRAVIIPHENLPSAENDYQTAQHLASEALAMIGHSADRKPHQEHHSNGFLTSSPSGSPRGHPGQSYHPIKGFSALLGGHMSYRSEM